MTFLSLLSHRPQQRISSHRQPVIHFGDRTYPIRHTLNHRQTAAVLGIQIPVPKGLQQPIRTLDIHPERQRYHNHRVPRRRCFWGRSIYRTHRISTDTTDRYVRYLPVPVPHAHIATHRSIPCHFAFDFLHSPDPANGSPRCPEAGV